MVEVCHCVTVIKQHLDTHSRKPRIAEQLQNLLLQEIQFTFKLCPDHNIQLRDEIIQSIITTYNYTLVVQTQKYRTERCKITKKKNTHL